MAPGRQGLRAWRKENDAGNRRMSVTPSEDVPVSGTEVPFEELLARELRKSNGNERRSTDNDNGKPSKKPFLKRGARGWWMRQPDAKQKVVKHTLASKGEEDEAVVKRTPNLQSEQQQQTGTRLSSASSSKTLSPVATPLEQIQPALKRPQILSPHVSPIRRAKHNNQVDCDDDGARRRQQSDEVVAWKNSSFRSTASTDIMGMKHVRQSYEAKQKREANEIAEFEAIERDLAAEKEAYLMEKQQHQHELSSRTEQRGQIYDNQEDTNHWKLPYSSFVSELHDQEQSRWQIPKARSIFDGSLDEEADSALVFDNQSTLSKDDWMDKRDGFTNQLRDHFGYGNHYGDPPSDLSAVSFDDSVPWDDGLSFQPRQSSAHEQSSNARAGDDLSDSRSDRDEKQKPPIARVSISKAKDDGKRAAQVKANSLASSRVPAKHKPGTRTGKLTQSRNRPAQSAASGMVLPAVIEEKLYELEEEVKFYKSETLQLQKRKDYYDQEVKKLAIERDEFNRYQQEQRILIEKEWDRERAKMKKEEKLQERQWKLRMNATISHQDRKDREGVEMLKAQIVKMQLDEKARASKWKAENDNLRQRVADLEEKNREQSDEIKFLEKDRLEQWEKYERVLKENQVASGSASKFGTTASAAPSVLSEKNELRTMDDVFAIKGTADELLQRWGFPRDDDSHNINEKEVPTHTASSGHHPRVQSSAVDDYNSKRYSLDQEDSHPLSDTGIFVDECNAAPKSANSFISDVDRVQPNSSAGTYEWAFPDAEDDASNSFDYASRKPGDGEGDGAISASTSSLSEHKTVTQEVQHPGGKTVILYTDGSRKIIFPDGNEKEIDANDHVVIKFTNGDHKEVFPDTGITVYYYYEAQTKLTTYPDNRKVYEFPNQQIEMSLPDGTTEIQFADGIKKTIRPNGDEFSVFPDGTTMLEQPDGLREVTLLNQKKIRYFPDGQMACVTPSGQETRVRSDSELKQLMENT